MEWAVEVEDMTVAYSEVLQKCEILHTGSNAHAALELQHDVLAFITATLRLK